MTDDRPFRPSRLPGVLAWAAFVGLVGMTAWVLLAACDVTVGGRPLFQFCTVRAGAPMSGDAGELAAEQARTQRLIREATVLERRVAAVPPCAP
ncbi:hypothetical protein F1188_18370 [Roseospira marina]|uniref:Uncharacterized protein n=1 Tax=Roseospira marina TaxID=140057 RepID=A0A5M6I6L9_9PROT|nr:hypothetical protein [Roseospira marina]KAA5603901.1 hypothetical protein F1188_18370 [Roseospira marina]MBB4315962.1 hypothetical protein [Roseospira marina]MBB5089168.1 hypothetical protein [Roseospira marina]